MVSSTRLCIERGLLAWGVCAVLAVSSAVQAKDPKDEEARALLQQGRKDYDLGRFKEALESYSKAYELKPLPDFLFNMAQCHRQLHQWSRASFFFKRYLDLSPGKVSNEDVVKDLIVECDAKQVEAEKKRAEDQATSRQVEIAKAEAQKAEADAQAKRDEQARKDKEEEDRRVAALAASTLPLGATPDASAAEPVAVSSGTPVYKKWWFWTAIGVVAAGAAATTVYFQTNPSPVTLGAPLNPGRAQ
jgi:tetratricopeptide (TPR) repeat protein